MGGDTMVRRWDYLRWNASHGQGSLEFHRSLVTRRYGELRKGLCEKKALVFLPLDGSSVGSRPPEAPDLSISNRRSGFIPLECRASLITSVEQKATLVLPSSNPSSQGTRPWKYTCISSPWLRDRGRCLLCLHRTLYSRQEFPLSSQNVVPN